LSITVSATWSGAERAALLGEDDLERYVQHEVAELRAERGVVPSAMASADSWASSSR
jgi:hypothetical protein